MISRNTPDSWQALQTEVGRILSECGFTVEVEKKIHSVRGAVELDVYAEETVRGRKYAIACECKYWKSRIPQAVVHGFRTVVQEIGANIGYIISMEGFQSGAVAAEHNRINLVSVSASSNPFSKNSQLEWTAVPRISSSVSTSAECPQVESLGMPCSRRQADLTVSDQRHLSRATEIPGLKKRTAHQP